MRLYGHARASNGSDAAEICQTALNKLHTRSIGSRHHVQSVPNICSKQLHTERWSGVDFHQFLVLSAITHFPLKLFKVQSSKAYGKSGAAKATPAAPLPTAMITYRIFYLGSHVVGSSCDHVHQSDQYHAASKLVGDLYTTAEAAHIWGSFSRS